MKPDEEEKRCSKWTKCPQCLNCITYSVEITFLFLDVDVVHHHTVEVMLHSLNV